MPQKAIDYSTYVVMTVPINFNIKTKMRVLIIIMFSVLSLTTFAQKKVAVYMTGSNSSIKMVLGDKLVTAFAQSGKYIAVERTSSFLSKLSSEQTYQRTGAVSDNEIAALGVQFGVNYVCVAEVTDVFDEQFISARLIDVETAEIVNTYNVNGKISTMNRCIQIANDVANNLTKGTFIEQAEEARAKAAEEARAKAAEEAKKASEEAARIAKAQWKTGRDQRIQEAQKVAEQVKAKQHKGYVDLGLPSGTLWRACNESKEYDYDTAIRKFGTMLPTREDWFELKENCEWIWNGCGYDITGPNGRSIVIPATQIGTHVYGGVGGSYWIYDSRYITSDHEDAPSFVIGFDDMSPNAFGGKIHPNAVRLIKSR